MRYPGGNSSLDIIGDGVGPWTGPKRLDLAWRSTEPNSSARLNHRWCRSAGSSRSAVNLGPEAPAARTWSNTEPPRWHGAGDLNGLHCWEKPHGVTSVPGHGWRPMADGGETAASTPNWSDSAKIMRWVDPISYWPPAAPPPHIRVRRLGGQGLSIASSSRLHPS